MGDHDGEWLGPHQGDPVSVGNHGMMTREGLPENRIQERIRKAKKPPGVPKKPKPQEHTDAPLYVEHEGRICRNRDGFPVALCNFVARIAEEILIDDGETVAMAFILEGQLCTGEPLSPVEVSSSQYNGLTWITARWGARAIIEAGQQTREYLRVAIQKLSGPIPRRTVYGHTGWRRIGGAWFYLHAGGALGADGNRTDIEVNPGAGHMAHYRLPDPPEGTALVRAIRDSLALLDIAPSKPEVGALLLASIYRAPLAEAVTIYHAAWLLGRTGAGKSAASAVALAHFGPGFAAGVYPATWADTPGSLERKAHAAKDALFVPDDFKPRGGRGEIDAMHAKADRLIHDGSGNQSGRGRMTQKNAYYPRGLVLVTGEDLLRGESARARATVAEIRPDPATRKFLDIDKPTLDALQASARSGRLAGAMAGYLRWLAPQMDRLKGELRDRLDALRDEALAQGIRGHSRTPATFASWMLGIEAFFRYAAESGAVAEKDAADYLKACRNALYSLMEDQDEHQASQDEVSRFLSLLASALASGRCHAFEPGRRGRRGRQGRSRRRRGRQGLPVVWLDTGRTRRIPVARPLCGMAGEGRVLSRRRIRPCRRIEVRGGTGRHGEPDPTDLVCQDWRAGLAGSCRYGKA